MFQNIFNSVLDKHAPIKVFQIRKNYVPFLSKETKLLMKERDILKTEATKTNDPVLLEEYRIKRNIVKDNVKLDRENYSMRKFDTKYTSSKNMWKSVKDLLGLNKNLSPTKLKTS